MIDRELFFLLHLGNAQVIHGFISPKCVIIDKTKPSTQAAEKETGTPPPCLKTWLVGWSNAADLEMLRTRPIAMSSLKDLTVTRTPSEQTPNLVSRPTAFISLLFIKRKTDLKPGHFVRGSRDMVYKALDSVRSILCCHHYS